MIVDVDGLTVVFGRRFGRPGHRALDSVSLQIEEGDAFALVGPNGAGKTTTVHCALGLLRPSSGCVRVFGQELEPGSAAFREIAFLPEDPHYHDYLTVEEAIRYYAALHNAEPSAAKLTRALEQVRLDNARSKRLSECSKGMKQKVGIAQCLLRQPRLLILDEPMRGLDPITVKDLRDLLIELNRSGVTIVINSHLLSEVEQLATRVAILSNGKLLAVKRLDELTGQDSRSDA